MRTIVLQRQHHTDKSTLGQLSAFGRTVWTLEDTKREHKVWGETRIPAGEFVLELRTQGGWHERMAARYPWHRGMIWLRHVPQFELIYIHPGNTPNDTLGCILVGLTQNEDWIGSSRAAYQRIYEPIAKAIQDGGCKILILDEEELDL